MRKIADFFMKYFFLLLLTAPLAAVEKPVSQSDPNQEITNLGQAIETARQDKIDILSPLSFNKAKVAHEKAIKLRDKGKDLSAIFEQINFGNDQLKQADTYSKVAKTTLPDAVKAREDAVTAGVEKFVKEFAKANKHFLELTQAIESNNLKWAKDHEIHVVKELRDLELRGIQTDAIGRAAEFIAEAKREGAAKRIPSSFAAAETFYKDAVTYIAQNRYEKEEIARRGHQAEFLAKRANELNRESKAIADMKPEDRVILIEKMLVSLANPVVTEDLRNLTFEEQKTRIETAIASLANENKQDEQTIQALQRRLAALGQQVESAKDEAATAKESEAMLAARLAAEKAVNGVYDDVDRIFSKEEAQVLKEGDHILIRLTSFKFDAKKSEILPVNYALLGKVKHAIQLVTNPKIVILGHTDPIGSNKRNLSLSEKRAKAVERYLIENEAVAESNISSIGKGDTAPIASNKTKAGRAKNRRIEVVITPQG